MLLNSPKKKPGVKGAQKVTTVKEVISGSVPLAKRDKFRSLIEGKHKVLKVFVESARAVARNALVAEEAWQLSKQNGVQIIPADLPFLFKHDASPGETFMRRVMLSVQEFERDMVVHRLTHGLLAKKATSNRINQSGQIKVNGAHSILERKAPILVFLLLSVVHGIGNSNQVRNSGLGGGLVV